MNLLNPAGPADVVALLAVTLFAAAATAWAVPGGRRPAWVQRHLFGAMAGAALVLAGVGMGGPGWVHGVVFVVAAVCAADAASTVSQHWQQRAQLVAAYGSSYRDGY